MFFANPNILIYEKFYTKTVLSPRIFLRQDNLIRFLLKTADSAILIAQDGGTNGIGKDRL